MTDLTRLPAFREGYVRMVVETPRGSNTKLAYDPENEVFEVSRALALGVTYPFDWGFIPQTRAADGDPVDALALHQGTTFPGVVLECWSLGIVDIEQDSADGHATVANPRVILVPVWEERLAELSSATFPDRIREELAQFFVSATFFTNKNPRILGWRGPSDAEEFIRGHLLN